MEKYFMHYCKNWGSEDCHPNVSKVKYPKEIDSGEEIPTWPYGKEQRKLDEICEECEFFERTQNGG